MMALLPLPLVPDTSVTCDLERGEWESMRRESLKGSHGLLKQEAGRLNFDLSPKGQLEQLVAHEVLQADLFKVPCHAYPPIQILGIDHLLLHLGRPSRGQTLARRAGRVKTPIEG